MTLARFYAYGTFGEDPHRFFSDNIANVFRWHRAIAEPYGPGSGGTIVSRVVGLEVIEDVEEMVQDIAIALIGYDDRFDHEAWSAAWARAS